MRSAVACDYPIIIPRIQIRSRLAELASEISLSYSLKGVNEIMVMPVLNGAMTVCADLIRLMENLDIDVKPIRVESYRGKVSDQIHIHLPFPDMRGRHVLLVEDILDTGKTLRTLLPRMHEARSFSTFFLLNKGLTEIIPDWTGFKVPASSFVVGYGMDHDGYLRNLPDIRAFPNNLT
jgi:hypoxanthine phosphoribosyltransferase